MSVVIAALNSNQDRILVGPGTFFPTLHSFSVRCVPISAFEQPVVTKGPIPIPKLDPSVGHLRFWGLVRFLIHHPGRSVHLHIEQREIDGVILLDLKGHLVLGDEDLMLRQRVRSLTDAGANKLILNLKEVSTIDTAVLGTLIYCAQKFQEAGGRLVLIHLSPSLGRLSDALKLNAAFDIYQDELEAVNSFFPNRTARHYDILEFVEEQEQHRHGDGQDKRESKEVPK